MDPTFQGRTPQVPYSQPRSLFRLSRRAFILIFALIAALIIGGILLANSGDKSAPLQQRLAARLATLQKLVTEGNNNINGADLKELNARLSIQVMSDNASITRAMKKLGFKDIAADIKANEADTASFTKLKDAALNNQFDSTYQTLITQKLDSTNALIKELYNTTRSTALKTALNSAYANLKLLEKQFAEQAGS